MRPRALTRGSALCVVTALAFTVAAACDGGGGDEPTSVPPSVAPSATATVGQSPTVVVLSTATPPAWATTEFVEPEYGYRLLYPSSYTKLPQFNAPTFNKFWSSAGALGPIDLKPGEVYLIVRVRENPSNYSAEVWAKEHRTETGPVTTVAGGRAVLAAGVDAYEVTVASGEAIHSVITYLRHAGRIYSIWMTPQSQEAMQQHRAEYDAIVASFRFID